MSTDLSSLVGRAKVPIPERGTYIPSWYVPHEGPALLPVTKNGKRVGRGFTVEDVLPERRWAIDKTGECLPQEQFEKLFKAWWSGYGTGDDPNFAPIPRVDSFVDKAIDAEGKYQPIGFDPYIQGAQPIEAKWTKDGELWEEKMRREAEENAQNRELLAKQTQLLMLGEMLTRGEITQEIFKKKFDELTAAGAIGKPVPETVALSPAPAPATAPEKRKAPAKVAAACGRMMDPRGIRWHEGRCTKCKQAKEEAQKESA